MSARPVCARQGAADRDGVHGDDFGRAIGVGHLHCDQPRRSQPADADALTRDAAQLRQLVKRHLHAHGELQRCKRGRGQVRGHFEQDVRLENVELRIAAPVLTLL